LTNISKNANINGNIEVGDLMRTIIKYVGIALVIVGILLVMKNLFEKDTDWSTNEKEENNKNKYYTVEIKLLDKEQKNYLSGSKLILKDKNNKLIEEFTTINKSHKISSLENGIYTLTQITAPKNYHLNKTNITFEIKNEDKEIIMYNIKMTESEIKEANTTKTEVGVDNTLSTKSIINYIIALISITLGLKTIYKEKNNNKS